MEVRDALLDKADMQMKHKKNEDVMHALSIGYCHI